MNCTMSGKGQMASFIGRDESAADMHAHESGLMPKCLTTLTVQ